MLPPSIIAVSLRVVPVTNVHEVAAVPVANVHTGSNNGVNQTESDVNQNETVIIFRDTLIEITWRILYYCRERSE